MFTYVRSAEGEQEMTDAANARRIAKEQNLTEFLQSVTEIVERKFSQ